MIHPSPILIAGILGSFALLTLAALRHAEAARLNRRLAAFARKLPDQDERGHGWTRLVEAVLVTGAKDRHEILLALRQAGFRDPRGFANFALARLAAALLALAIVLLLPLPIGGRARIFVVFAAFAIPFLAAKHVLRSFAGRRLRQIRRELPFLIDMLILMLESGASLDQCFRQFAQTKMAGMEQTRAATIVLVDDIQKGMAHDAALARWSDRLAADGVRDLAGLIAQAMMHGTELVPSLRDFAREVAEKRIAATRESIGRKSSQMTMVMVVCLLPALMIILAGPAVATIQDVFVRRMGR